MSEPAYLRDRIVSTKWMPVIPRPNKPAIRYLDEEGWRSARFYIERPQLSFSPTPKYESLLENSHAVQLIGGCCDGRIIEVGRISPTLRVPRERVCDYMVSGFMDAPNTLMAETYYAKKIARRWAIRRRNSFTLRTIFIGWAYVHESFKHPALPTKVRWTESESWVELNGFNGGAA